MYRNKNAMCTHIHRYHKHLHNRKDEEAKNKKKTKMEENSLAKASSMYNKIKSLRSNYEHNLIK